MKQGYSIFSITSLLSGVIFIAWMLIFNFRGHACGDEPRKKKGITISMGGGFMRTHLRNSYSDDLYPRTYEGRIYFGDHEFIRGVINVEHQPPVDLKPEWMGRQSTLIDLQSHFLCYFSRNNSIYPIIGITYQKFSAFYTGYGNIQRLQPYINKKYEADYFGGLIGFGIEFRLYKRIYIYGETRFRLLVNNEKLGKNKKDPEASDQLCLGLKIDLPKLGRIFRKPGDKFHWF